MHSLRRCCGVAVAPREGLVSRDGIIPISFTRDRAGPMARNVTDAALMLELMAGMENTPLMPSFTRITCG